MAAVKNHASSVKDDILCNPRPLKTHTSPETAEFYVMFVAEFGAMLFAKFYKLVVMKQSFINLLLHDL